MVRGKEEGGSVYNCMENVNFEERGMCYLFRVVVRVVIRSSLVSLGKEDWGNSYKIYLSFDWGVCWGVKFRFVVCSFSF